MRITKRQLRNIIKEEKLRVLQEYSSAPTNEVLTVDISNILEELEEIITVVENGNTETPDMGGPDVDQQDTILDFVGDAIVNLKRALSELSRPPRL